MSILNKVFRNEKLIINLFFSILFIIGLLFGILFYFYGNLQLVEINKYLFFFKDNETTNNYNLYLIITSLYIFLSLIISTSFLGTLLNSFVIFSKGMQISIATIFYFTLNKFDASMLFLGYFPQLFLEIVLIYVISIISLKLSLNCFTISFLTPEVFNSRKIINYILDYIIIVLIIISLSMAFKVYAL
ncbi:hypothetical protein [Thomasclavelia sp.]|uniref:hypothetical protein n=1 Tax=Thomasclavelia sp. TaxID=3025757 RepID=UPI0025DE6702|nr:hypothetical protein [Thomasclavelia sp.]